MKYTKHMAVWQGLLAVSLAVAAQAAELPSPALLILNKEDASLAILNPSTNQVVGRVPTGDGPHEVVVSDDGKLAFVSNYGKGGAPGHTISVIDLHAMKEKTRVDVSPLQRPHGLAFAEGHLYFTAEDNRLIARYDPVSSKIDWFLGTGQGKTHMVLAGSKGSVLFTANIESDTITVSESGKGPGDWTQTVVAVGKGPEGLDLSSDGRQLWTAHSRDGGVSVIDVSTKKVVQTIDLKTKRSNRVKLTPDGKLALVSDMGGGELVVVDAQTYKEQKRLPVGRSPEGILIVPDGSRAYVAVTGENKVSIFDLKTLTVTGQNFARYRAGRYGVGTEHYRHLQMIFC